MKKILHNMRSLVCRFHKNDDGAVAMLYGPMLIVLLLAAGLSIDYARGYLVKKEIARALDAAVLAAGSLPVTNEAAMRTLAKQYFAANISASTKTNYDPKIKVTFGGNDITVTSSADVPTILMKLAGFDTMNVKEKSVVGRTLVNIEVALVLDNTGSMRGSKLSSLKAAAKSLVDTLYATEDAGKYVEIALIPFTGSVNVGSVNKLASWMDDEGDSKAAQEDYPSSQTYKWNKAINGMSAYEVLDYYKKSWSGCVRARVGTDVNSDGDTVPLDLWDIPPSSDADTKWAPFLKPLHTLQNKKNLKKVNKKVNQVLNYNYDDTCPIQEILPLTSDPSTIKSKIDGMEADGWTSIPVGLVWGWRVLSSAEPYTEGDDESNTENRKVIVVLTDGTNNHGAYDDAVYSAYGLPTYGHLGTGRPGNRLDDKLEAVCANAKSQDILIYSITFELRDTGTQKLMRDCATREDMYFNSPDGASLKEAFNKIATGLQKLRLKQ